MSYIQKSFSYLALVSKQRDASADGAIGPVVGDCTTPNLAGDATPPESCEPISIFLVFAYILEVLVTVLLLTWRATRLQSCEPISILLVFSYIL